MTSHKAHPFYERIRTTVLTWVSFSTRRQKAHGQDWTFFVSPPGSDTLQAPSSGPQRGRRTRPARQKPEPTTHSILTASQILLLILGRGEAGTRGRGGRGNQKGPGEGRGGPALQIVPRARQPPPGWASPGQEPVFSVTILGAGGAPRANKLGGPVQVNFSLLPAPHSLEEPS